MNLSFARALAVLCVLVVVATSCNRTGTEPTPTSSLQPDSEIQAEGERAQAGQPTTPAIQPTDESTVADDQPTDTHERTAVEVQPTNEPMLSDDEASSVELLAPGDHDFAIRHDRRNRNYIVHVPPDPGPNMPVVIALHGGGGNGPDFRDQNGLDVVADREGFIAVYPEGSGVLPNLLHTWNSGRTCCGFALDRKIDDVGFLRAVIVDLAERHDIDATRVYMTGHSNGAMMAYRFAAEAPELVAAIAPVGGMADFAISPLAAPVATLHIHSLDDPRALYEGGEGPPFPGTDRTVFHEPVRAGLDEWAAANGCASAPEDVDSIIGTGNDEGHTANLMRWSQCDGDVLVEHLLLTGSGHGWPGITTGPWLQNQLGPPTTIVNASDEVWEFVSQFQR